MAGLDLFESDYPLSTASVGVAISIEPVSQTIQGMK